MQYNLDDIDPHDFSFQASVLNHCLALLKMTLPILLTTLFFTRENSEISVETWRRKLNFFFSLTSLGFYSVVLLSFKKFQPIENLVELEILAVLTNLSVALAKLLLQLEARN